MSKKHIAPCGLDCARCDIYIATQADSDSMRMEVAKNWSALFHYSFTKDDINCDGCLGGGRMSVYCHTMCEVRQCAVQRGIIDCKACPDYKCNALIRNHEASASYTP